MDLNPSTCSLVPSGGKSNVLEILMLKYQRTKFNAKNIFIYLNMRAY